jgi:hypothetical protein
VRVRAFANRRDRKQCYAQVPVGLQTRIQSVTGSDFSQHCRHSINVQEAGNPPLFGATHNPRVHAATAINKRSADRNVSDPLG